MFDEEKAISMLKGRRSHLVTVDRWQKSVYLPELQEQLGIKFEGRQYWRFSGVQRAAGQFRGQLDPVENMLYTRKHQIPCEMSQYVKRRLEQMTPGENGRHSLFGTFWPTWDEPMALDASEEDALRHEKLMLGSVRLSCPHPWEVEICGTLSGIWPWGYEIMLYSWSRSAPVWIRVHGRFGRANQLGRIVFVRARMSLQDMTLKHIKHHNVRFVGREQAGRILDAIKPRPEETATHDAPQGDQTPTVVTSGEGAPVADAPVEGAPSEETPVAAAPAGEAAVADATTSQDTPAEVTPVEATSAEQAPVEASPEEAAPVEAAPVVEATPEEATSEEATPEEAAPTAEVASAPEEEVDGEPSGDEAIGAGDESGGPES